MCSTEIYSALRCAFIIFKSAGPHFPHSPPSPFPPFPQVILVYDVHYNCGTVQVQPFDLLPGRVPRCEMKSLPW